MALYELTLSLDYAGEDALDKRKVMADSIQQVIKWGMEQVKTYWGENGYMEGDVSYREDGHASCRFGDVKQITSEWVEDLRKPGRLIELRWVAFLRESPPCEPYAGFFERVTKKFAFPEEESIIMRLAGRWNNWGFRIPKIMVGGEFDSYPNIGEAVQGMNNLLNDMTTSLTVGDFVGPYPIVDGVPFEDWQGEE